MKYVAYTCGINTPPYVIVKNLHQINKAISKLSFPLFIKPAKAGDSLGIDADSLVKNEAGLQKKSC